MKGRKIEALLFIMLLLILMGCQQECEPGREGNTEYFNYENQSNAEGCLFFTNAQLLALAPWKMIRKTYSNPIYTDTAVYEGVFEIGEDLIIHNQSPNDEDDTLKFMPNEMGIISTDNVEFEFIELTITHMHLQRYFEYDEPGTGTHQDLYYEHP